MRIAWSFVLMFAMLQPAFANTWWNKDWEYRSRIVVDPAASQAPLVPVRLHLGNFPFGDAAADGADLRFVAADDQTPLNYHFELYDSTEQLAVAWVQVPTSGGEERAIWLYYGNREASPVAGAMASYEPSSAAAFHFSEREGNPRDSTEYGTQVRRFTGTAGADGITDAGADFMAASSLELVDSPQFDSSRGWTVSTWIKLAAAGQTGRILSRSSQDTSLELSLDQGKLQARFRSSGQELAAESSEPLATGQWKYLVLSWSDRLSVYVDAKPVLTLAVPAVALGGDLVFGAGADSVPGFTGALDELRVANVGWPLERVVADFIAADPLLDAVTFAGAEVMKAGGQYLFVLGILARAVTNDGWVIIGLIGLLGFVAAEVMIVKLRLLKRLERANADFIAQFHMLGKDPTTLFAPLEEKSATGLAALYQGGVREYLRQRDAVVEEGGSSLAAAQIEVIKASIDTTIVGEHHRLNQSMVLVTLAVSAAPFLGLLGTVVGIMMTFGAIAAAGDVNVNTIAPGVAAALTTTVAGLAVAIPVLFGYNLLATRIREFISTMDVFANELVGRLAAARIAR
jgi:biopolymer transport protein ExbB